LEGRLYPANQSDLKSIQKAPTRWVNRLTVNSLEINDVTFSDIKINATRAQIHTERAYRENINFPDQKFRNLGSDAPTTIKLFHD